ncbi:hypothetical protein ND861_07055 [Leptospira sp. 2 VSF19]|uniref:HEPN domain-containing protein n=1 Tax=Leptospira soteropolitanensis TaxID=2950025 RepID=A0AAW5VIE4_9LEPT|nr:hypothetical protein [Leptospira soteropolitanensis]MCW7494649.1 hypothetical protein [Leptospira soteropolitanensis]MCW7499989.1 hypothetical protein [Leptospira soteropolitanensis]MCW7522240.1 hypothetical protein [Leptospira soteropolitanensis]MCW7526096.1 hypothetical protein [Leptospira soteropolitanensis]MCW7529792.1 hypothetical protein [Leptospira soteropolitanensis]
MDQESKQIISVRKWLITAEEYLKDSKNLLDFHLKANRSTITRPTVLLFAYFLENLLKGYILVKKNLTQLDKKYQIHLKKELFEKAELHFSKENHQDIVEFLNHVTNWGKYPFDKSNSQGNVITSKKETKLTAYQNETFVFSSFENFQELLSFAIHFLELISNEMINEKKLHTAVGIKETLGRLNHKLIEMEKAIKGDVTQKNHQSFSNTFSNIKEKIKNRIHSFKSTHCKGLGIRSYENKI